jgi:cell division protein FtsI (penicillin-binding protein 3)
VGTLPDKVLAEFHARGDTTSAMPEMTPANVAMRAPAVRPQVESLGNGAVVVDGGRRVAVPEFQGAALRAVVENAGRLGLRVQTLGSGLAREQTPAAGTMVPPGTEVVVRFAR